VNMCLGGNTTDGGVAPSKTHKNANFLLLSAAYIN
jgi:hypothetical protein